MLPETTRIGFVHLNVADLPKALAFYGELLGFRPGNEDPQTVNLSATGTDPPDLVLTSLPGARRVRRAAALYHFALLYPTRADLGRGIRRLLEQRWAIDGASDHLVSEAFYLRDPEGNGIELYADRPSSQWSRASDGRLQMASDALDVEGILSEGTGPWDGLPPAARIGHIHLHVSNLARAEAFYHGLLGFDVVTREYPGAVFMAAGGYHHHLGVNIWAGTDLLPVSAGQQGLRAFEVRLPDAASVDAAAARLRAGGAGVEATQTPDGRAGMVTHDPDGIGVVLAAAAGH